MGTSAQLLLFLLINMNILVILLSLITTGLCQSLDIGRSCGGRLTAPSGTIMSPGYPSGYSNNQDCEWTIGPAPRNMVVKFTVESMDLEPDRGCRYACRWCHYDYVQFLETDGTELFKICATTIPGPIFAIGKHGAPTVKFHSDESETRMGFKIKYEYVYRSDVVLQIAGQLFWPYNNISILFD